MGMSRSKMSAAIKSGLVLVNWKAASSGTTDVSVCLMLMLLFSLRWAAENVAQITKRNHKNETASVDARTLSHCHDETLTTVGDERLASIGTSLLQAQNQRNGAAMTAHEENCTSSE